ncbi:MAG: lipoate--protein ligase family protein [Acidilobaceae archaeon]|nr:lipoate--protein ligase family protein [Acidilobaceae archaeon]MCX8165257.1 lipoate--protein ligase family protein [Acidilobaceae archaeon]MDW7973683.1 biotin/lipoate A/B protein ligase family protein [Sulfolobales archaeon]
MKLVRCDVRDPRESVRLEELLLERAKRGGEEVIRIWFNHPSVVIGYSLKECEEVDCEEARRLGIPIVRRVSGGGAVYHDLGNINFTIVRRWEGLKGVDEAYEESTRVAMRALELLGLKGHVENGNDVVVGEHKVSGAAAAIRRDAYLVHFTFLVATNMEVLKRVILPRLDRVARGEVTPAKYNPANLRDLAGVRVGEALEALRRAARELYPIEQEGGCELLAL